MRSAGITPSNNELVAIQPRSVKKTHMQILGGVAMVGQPTDQDIEELVTSEAGTELRHVSIVATCPCGNMIKSSDEAAYCSTCGAQLCGHCSKEYCRLDNCGRHFCRAHRVALAQGFFICSSHMGANGFGSIVSAISTPTPMLQTPFCQVLQPPQNRKRLRIGSSMNVYCPSCSGRSRVTIAVGSQRLRCGFCRNMYTASFSEESGGVVRVNIE